MPKVTSTAPGLRPFEFHRMDLVVEGGQGVGTCPFCDRERKFYVNAETGLWDCKTCGEKGNPLSFLRKLWEVSDKATQSYDDLANHRGLLYPETLIHWGVCRSVIDGTWLVPAYSPDTKLHQLYRYIPIKKDGGMHYTLLPTPKIWPEGQAHGLFGVPLYDSSKPEVWLCEGPWDGMAAWEIARVSKIGPDGNLMFTGNPDSSMLSYTNILACPGANVWQESWQKMFGGKITTLLGDNDHPGFNQKTGNPTPPVSYNGLKRIANSFTFADHKPAQLNYLWWGDEGYNMGLPDGFDVRDILKIGEGDVELRIAGLQKITESFKPSPGDWIAGNGAASAAGRVGMNLIPCNSWGEVVMAFRKAMKWLPGLEKALAVMLASVTSVMAPGSQLWIRVIGPAGCGKTTLAEALSTNEQYVFAKSTLTGFHSGFKGEGGKEQDNSIIPLIMNKTFITKDGDTILQAENKGKILGQARDLFDRVARVFYGNQINRAYAAVNMTWILCGTGSLRVLDQSELGERFLTVTIMEGIDDDLEDAVLLKIAHRTSRNMSMSVNGSPESREDADMVYAKQVTGGYVSYLREHCEELYGKIEMSDEMLMRVIRMGKFVAYARARPSQKQKEIAEREFGGRLVEQFVRLAKSLAVVYQRPTVDEYIMDICKSVARDSTVGQTLELMRYMYEEDEEGGSLPKALAILINEKDEVAWNLLTFLAKIKAAEYVSTELAPGVPGPRKWKLTARMKKLYEEVILPPMAD